MKHIDLFSGIGGFAYACKEVWGEEYEPITFCEIDKYCQSVLRRHFPDVPIWGDIRELIANARRQRQKEHEQQATRIEQCGSVDLITGGFPCQPFSHAGKRRGKSDDRFLWPAMLECIRIFKPAWIIAENVYGLLSIEGGLVFEQVRSDLEKTGYEVWPFVIPACAVNAPHRRDRVWIVAHRRHTELTGRTDPKEGSQRETFNQSSSQSSNAPIPAGKRLEGKANQEGQSPRFNTKDWQFNWKEVAFRTCVRGVDDGISGFMDGVRISESKHRTERLKMLGNAIVPQVAMELMRSIKQCEDGSD